MDLETLKIFEAVAAELSVTRAAARLGRAPSNVTTRIQQLEAELDAELFIRLGKRITLSTAGQRFLTYAQRLLALEDEARQALGGSGSLRIGSMESTAASRLPAPLAAFNRTHPATRLEVSTGPSGPLVEEVRDGRLDCAFVALPAELENEPALIEMGLQSAPVWKESLLLLLPPADAGATAPAELRTRTLAAFKPGCTYRAMAEQRLGIVAGSAWRIQELGSYHAMVAAVAAGACVTLLPRSVLDVSGVSNDLNTLEMGTVTTRLLWRRGYETPVFQAFAGEFLGETCT
ncbi:DNA-binding transcriptional LysR family regulator [Onishia taeanensis]|uniref:DNA-binding transcriptional LysR family regulator n=1 Tax=Onishia taeanensis TaxID=284577 RepID=A0A328XUA3_9GAMM|nr:LysR substrate-binding domain-containing protein [Halomonas taeanensis]RAR59801.1 DNA-binding transcriptional LysR family regulator [Halomonas taeanensis]